MMLEQIERKLDAIRRAVAAEAVATKPKKPKAKPAPAAKPKPPAKPATTTKAPTAKVMRKIKTNGDKLARGIGRYTAVYERDGSAWMVEIAEVSHCHTSGESLWRARSKIREALGLWVDDAATAEIVDVIDTPLPARAAKPSATEPTRPAKPSAKQTAAVGVKLPLRAAQFYVYDDTARTVGVKLPGSVHARALRAGASSLKSLVLEAIEEYLQRRGL